MYSRGHNNTSKAEATCSCSFVSQSLGRPPEFLLAKPPKLPASFLSSLDAELLVRQFSSHDDNTSKTNNKNNNKALIIRNSNALNYFYLQCAPISQAATSRNQRPRTTHQPSVAEEAPIISSTTPTTQNTPLIASSDNQRASAPSATSASHSFGSFYIANPQLFVSLVVISSLATLLLLILTISLIVVQTLKANGRRSDTKKKNNSDDDYEKRAINPSHLQAILTTSNHSSSSGDSSAKTSPHCLISTSLSYPSPSLSPFSSSPKSNSTLTYTESSSTSNPSSHGITQHNSCNHHMTNSSSNYLRPYMQQQQQQQHEPTDNDSDSVGQLIRLNKAKLQSLLEAQIATQQVTQRSSELVLSVNDSLVNKNNAMAPCANKQRLQMDTQQHYYESIGGETASQFYFDVDTADREARNMLEQRPQRTNATNSAAARLNLGNQHSISGNLHTISNSNNNNNNSRSNDLIAHYPITFCSCTLMKMNNTALSAICTGGSNSSHSSSQHCSHEQASHMSRCSHGMADAHDSGVEDERRLTHGQSTFYMKSLFV